MKKTYLFVALAVIVLLLAGGAILFLRRKTPPSDPIPVQGGSAQASLALTGIPYFLQNDPQWGNQALGGSNESMAAAGCTVTCTAMALHTAGISLDPLQLCTALKQRNGFTQQGYLVWDTIGSLTNGKVRVEFPPLTHEAIETELAAKRPLIAKIMLAEKIPHWVLIVGKQGGEYLIMDPLNSDKTLLRLSTRTSRIYAVRVLRTQ
ncbi:MAG: C39 family peptidase [Blastocatellia bacterium]|nr:C39 family peptidase [Blastocatellia bacterium]